MIKIFLYVQKINNINFKGLNYGLCNKGNI